MRYTKACLAGGLVILLGTFVGCSNDDDNNNNGGGIPVADKTFNRLFNCSETPTGGTAACVDSQASQQIQFTRASGGGGWEFRTVPDTGYVATGTFSGNTFNFTATSPNGFTEEGSWEFQGSGNAFSGTTTYTAIDNSYSGQCTTKGAVAPSIPPDADPIGTCP